MIVEIDVFSMCLYRYNGGRCTVLTPTRRGLRGRSRGLEGTLPPCFWPNLDFLYCKTPAPPLLKIAGNAGIPKIRTFGKRCTLHSTCDAIWALLIQPTMGLAMTTACSVT